MAVCPGVWLAVGAACGCGWLLGGCLGLPRGRSGRPAWLTWDCSTALWHLVLFATLMWREVRSRRRLCVCPPHALRCPSRCCRPHKRWVWLVGLPPQPLRSLCPWPSLTAGVACGRFLCTDRGDVPRGTAEIFFRKVKFWKGDAPPAFVSHTHIPHTPAPRVVGCAPAPARPGGRNPGPSA